MIKKIEKIDMTKRKRETNTETSLRGVWWHTANDLWDEDCYINVAHTDKSINAIHNYTKENLTSKREKSTLYKLWKQLSLKNKQHFVIQNTDLLMCQYKHWPKAEIHICFTAKTKLRVMRVTKHWTIVSICLSWATRRVLLILFFKHTHTHFFVLFFVSCEWKITKLSSQLEWVIKSCTRLDISLRSPWSFYLERICHVALAHLLSLYKIDELSIKVDTLPSPWSCSQFKL